MKDDMIKRSDAIKALCDAVDNKGDYEGEWLYTDEFCKVIGSVPSADRPQEVIAQITFDEEKLREIVKEAVDRFKEEHEIVDRQQGEWIYGEHDVAMCDGYRCDRCGFFVPWDYEHKSIDFINDYNYCPHCGARMKGADDDSKRD